jgi:hypothetical protein
MRGLQAPLGYRPYLHYPYTFPFTQYNAFWQLEHIQIVGSHISTIVGISYMGHVTWKEKLGTWDAFLGKTTFYTSTDQ